MTEENVADGGGFSPVIYVWITKSVSTLQTVVKARKWTKEGENSKGIFFPKKKQRVQAQEL